MNRRLLCFGDSNTYGYDPRSYLGDRYAAHVRWTGILHASPGWEVLNQGQNGRTIPVTDRELAQVDALLSQSVPLHAMTVLLGGNDLLQRPSLSAEAVSERMERLLERILAHPAFRENPKGLLLLAPPPMVPGAWVTEERLMVESARLATCYGALARLLGISFADSGQWKVSLTFDGVHFSEAGHRAFARGLGAVLEDLFQGEEIP